MLTFFFRYLPELIRKGNLYIAQPPLYRVDVGKETFWAKDDVHKEELLEQILQKRPNAKPDITRFKGLGEMMPRTLAETTLNPKTRTLLRVTIESLI
jgi:DNA gyrase/topoisomerase IV subunit B